jgi:di/tricarboxylate transporter
VEALTQLGWQAWLSIGVVVAAFALFASGRGSPDTVTTAGLTLLLVTGVLTPTEALAGSANPGMLTVAVLYVVVTGLTETGAVNWIGQALLGQPRSAVHARWRLMAPSAALSSVLNNTPLVAILIPAVQDWAKRYRLELSRLMIPLSYATIAGGTCSLIGTSTNLVIDGLYRAHSGASLGLFEPAWVGLPVVVIVIGLLLVAGHRLLPDRVSVETDFADGRQYTAEMLVPRGSPLAGKSIEEAGLRQLPGLFLIEIERDEQIMPAVSPHELLRAGDRLVFAGVIDSVLDLHHLRGLIPATDQVFKLGGPRQDRCFVEAVVSDSGPMIGLSVREGRFRSRYNAVIIAVARSGERIRRKIGDIDLKPGDTSELPRALRRRAPPAPWPVPSSVWPRAILGRPWHWSSSPRPC